MRTVPGTDPRKTGETGASGVSTPRNSLGPTSVPPSASSASAQQQQRQSSGDTSGIFTPARERVRIEDRRVDIQELIDEASLPLKNRKNAAKDVWNLQLIEYFELNRFCDSSGRIDYTEAASALRATTNIYKNRVEDLKEKTNMFASNMGSAVRKTEDEDAEGDEPRGVLTKENMSIKRAKKRNKDEPILVDSRKIQLKLNANINSVDPLFRKTQVDYDKGNYNTLLLSSMVPDVLGRVSFEDYPLNTQISEKEPLNLNHEYLENDIDEFRGMLPTDYSTKHLVPKLTELRRVMAMDGSELADLDHTMDNTYMDTFGDQSAFTAEGEQGEYNASNILDGIDYYADGAGNGDDMGEDDAAQDQVDMPYQMDKDEVLAHMSIGDSRRSITYAQRKNIHERQADSTVAAPKPKRAKLKIGVKVDADLQSLRKKVFVKGDSEKMKLPAIKFQPRTQSFEAIDLRDFLRLNIRPDIKPETMWRTIERGRVSENQKTGDGSDYGQQGPKQEVFDDDLHFDGGNDLVGRKDVAEDNIADMAAQHLDIYEREEEDIEMVFDDPTDDDMYSSDANDGDSFYRRQKSGLYLQRNVDVATFKDNIWENLEELQHEIGSETVKKTGITMGGIMNKTVEKYRQRESAETNDLVGPLFFLNLLHLANETGISFGTANGCFTQDDLLIYPPTGNQLNEPVIPQLDGGGVSPAQTPTRRPVGRRARA